MSSFVDIWQYMPHGMCLLWQPWLVVLWAGSDLLIFLAYMAIPFSLMRVIRGRNDIQHRGLVLLFASFILLCGLTHLLGIVTLWWPIYPYVGMIKLLTGLVSAATAVVLFRLVPTLIALPGHAELTAVNQELTNKIAELEAAEARVRATNDRLEELVAERTDELKQANDKLAVVAREAVHRGKNLLSVVGSIARQSARGAQDVNQYVATLVGRIDALSSATAAVVGGGTDGSTGLKDVVESQTKPLRMTYADRVRVDGTPESISAEVAQQIGLAVHELATNAQKYGALSADDGDVSIAWRREMTEGRQTLVFEWTETGGPSATREGPPRSGFGHMLVTRVVPAMLQGTAHHVIEDGRMTYRLAIPVEMLGAEGATDGDAALAARIVDESFGVA